MTANHDTATPESTKEFTRRETTEQIFNIYHKIDSAFHSFEYILREHFTNMKSEPTFPESIDIPQAKDTATPQDDVVEIVAKAIYESACQKVIGGSAYYKNIAKAAIAAYTASAKSADQPEIPTETMCDAARWFIMARDAGLYTWGAIARGKPLKTIDYIEDKIKNDPMGHITKWDFAECIYMLMQAPPIAEAHGEGKV